MCEMVPELRAASDRLMHAGGYLRHLSAEMRPNELERHCKATGLSVRQTMGHIVFWLERQALTMQRHLSGELAVAPPVDVDEINRQFAEQSAETPVATLLSRYDSAYALIVDVYGRMPPQVADTPVGAETVGAVALRWSAHPQRHAVDFAEALPRLRFDPLLLSWALNAQLTEPSELQRQLKLAQAARSYLKAREESDDS